MAGKKSNYEKMQDEMAAVFLEYEQGEMIRRFGLERDEDALYIVFVGKRYRVDRRTGEVRREGGEKAGYNEAMTIYDVLCYSRKDCSLAHEWVNVGSLSKVQGGSLAKGGHFFQNAGDFFDGKAKKLAEACERLHGKKLPKGDVAYELELFLFLPVIIRFWESDEDFPATLQILVDRNILDFMHYETVMFAFTHLLERLREECGAV